MKLERTLLNSWSSDATHPGRLSVVLLYVIKKMYCYFIGVILVFVHIGLISVDGVTFSRCSVLYC